MDRKELLAKAFQIEANNAKLAEQSRRKNFEMVLSPDPWECSLHLSFKMKSPSSLKKQTGKFFSVVEFKAGDGCGNYWQANSKYSQR